jgi:hypothetical protein
MLGTTTLVKKLPKLIFTLTWSLEQRAAAGIQRRVFDFD